MRKFVTAAAVVATSVALAAGGAHASPGTDTVGFTASVTPEGTVIVADAGTVAVEDGALKLKAANGTVLAGTELSFRVDDFVFPIAAEIKDRTATLRPLFDIAHAEYRPVALPFENQAPFKSEYEREQAAWNRMVSTISMGAAIGATVGSLGGAAVGCVLGGIAGATVASATIIGLFGPFIPAAAVGCIGGVLAIGAIGVVAGQLLVTAPVAVMAAVQYFTTINAPAPGK
ncbi:hypothetical protein [Nocardia canadensis]|uniref:hypothetical protein n=1 Tax=Nocardia canadensis TaxID=3065238 RepID=UPI00292E4E3C|nr:hypothetical protein [Nocardia canadensis]